MKMHFHLITLVMMLLNFMSTNGMNEAKSYVPNIVKWLLQYAKNSPSVIATGVVSTLAIIEGTLLLLKHNPKSMSDGWIVEPICPKNKINEFDENGQLPLIQAVKEANLKRTEILLNNDADPNAKDQNGQTALTVIMSKNSIPLDGICLPKRVEINIQLIKLLLDHNADPNVPGIDGITPLIRAASLSNVGYIQCLLDKKASIDAQDDTGRTALMHIANLSDMENHDAVICLLDKKAQLNIKDMDDKTALDIATANYNTNIAELLYSYETSQ